MEPPRYVSFLVRLWCEPGARPRVRAITWQGEVEHIQSGRRATFDSLDELLAWLRQEVTGMETANPANE